MINSIKHIFIIVGLVFLSQQLSFGLYIKGYNGKPNAQICNNENIELEANDGNYTNYRWYVSCATCLIGTEKSIPFQTIVQESNNSNYAYITLKADSAGYTLSTTLNLVYFTIPPNPNLGPDTAFCDRDTITIKNSTTYSSDYTFKWVNDISNTTDQIKAHETGSYTLEVKDKWGCIWKDTKNVTRIIDHIDLGGDKRICGGNEIELKNKTTLNSAFDIKWSTLETTNSIKVKTAGKYSLQVISPAPYYCTYQDTIEVDVKPSPTINLGPDTLVCGIDTYIQNNRSNNATNDNSQYLWNDDPSLTATTLEVKEPTRVKLVLTSEFGCKTENYRDIQVFDPTFSFGNDTTICEGNEITLSPQGNFIENTIYTWNGIVGKKEKLVTSPGNYELEISHQLLNDCSYKDDINVDYTNNPEFDLGVDIEDTLLFIDGTFDGDFPQEKFKYQWVNLNDDKLLSEEPGILLTTSTFIHLTVINKAYLCKGVDSLTFTKKELESDFFVSTAFSPSSSIEENRVFKVQGTDISSDDFLVVIYDRWGNVIYESTDFELINTKGWDGTLDNGKKLTTGSYAFSVKAKLISGKEIKRAGMLAYIQ